MCLVLFQKLIQSLSAKEVTLQRLNNGKLLLEQRLDEVLKQKELEQAVSWVSKRLIIIIIMINFVLRGWHITVKRLTNPWPSNSRSNWNLEMLIFVEGGQPENPENPDLVVSTSLINT